MPGCERCPVTRRLVTTAALVVAAALTTVGCATSEGETVPSPQDRPSLEAVAEELSDAEERIRAAISEIVPSGQWTRVRESGTSPCTEKGETVEGAKRLFPGNWKFDARPSDEQWVRIREAVLSILGDYGYTEIAMDTPVGSGAAFEVAGRFEGSSFSLHYDRATAMSFSSGCHFPEGSGN